MEISVVIQHDNPNKLKWLRDITYATCKVNHICIHDIQCFPDRSSCLQAAVRKSTNLIILTGNSSGLKFGKHIRPMNRSAVLIYVDSDMTHVLDAFARLPIAYLPENFSIQQYAEALYAGWKWLGMQNDDLLNLKTRHSSIQIRQNEIEYVESNYRQAIIHMNNGNTHTISSKLDDIENQLDSGRFCRCHQSYLINLAYVDRIEHANREVFFLSGAAVFASKARYAELLRRMERTDVRIEL